MLNTNLNSVLIVTHMEIPDTAIFPLGIYISVKYGSNNQNISSGNSIDSIPIMCHAINGNVIDY